MCLLSVYSCPFRANSLIHTSMHQQLMLSNLNQLWYTWFFFGIRKKCFDWTRRMLKKIIKSKHKRPTEWWVLTLMSATLKQAKDCLTSLKTKTTTWVYDLCYSSISFTSVTSIPNHLLSPHALFLTITSSLITLVVSLNWFILSLCKSRNLPKEMEGHNCGTT